MSGKSDDTTLYDIQPGGIEPLLEDTEEIDQTRGHNPCCAAGAPISLLR
jgi:hypothetical protein